MADHVPGPWNNTGPAALEWGLEPTQPEEFDFNFQEVHGPDGDLVAIAAGEANARFIVAAANAHEELLAACRFTLSVMQSNHDDVELSEQMAIKKLKAAIAKATKLQAQ